MFLNFCTVKKKKKVNALGSLRGGDTDVKVLSPEKH